MVLVGQILVRRTLAEFAIRLEHIIARTKNLVLLCAGG